MGVYFVLQTGVQAVVDLEPRRFLLYQEDILQLLKVIDTLDPYLMFLLIDNLLARKIRLDNILKTAIIPQQAQLNNMIAKFLPFHSLISINIDLLKKINQSQSQILLQFLILVIVFEMF